MIGLSAGRPARAAAAVTAARASSRHTAGTGMTASRTAPAASTAAPVSRTGHRQLACRWRRASSASHCAASPRSAAACRRCQLPSSADAHRTSRATVRTAPGSAYSSVLAAYFGARTAWNPAWYRASLAAHRSEATSAARDASHGGMTGGRGWLPRGRNGRGSSGGSTAGPGRTRPIRTDSRSASSSSSGASSPSGPVTGSRRQRPGAARRGLRSRRPGRGRGHGRAGTARRRMPSPSPASSPAGTVVPWPGSVSVDMMGVPPCEGRGAALGSQSVSRAPGGLPGYAAIAGGGSVRASASVWPPSACGALNAWVRASRTAFSHQDRRNPVRSISAS